MVDPSTVCMYPPQIKMVNLAADRWVVVEEVEARLYSRFHSVVQRLRFGESLIMRATRLPLQSMAVLSRFFFFFSKRGQVVLHITMSKITLFLNLSRSLHMHAHAQVYDSNARSGG